MQGLPAFLMMISLSAFACTREGQPRETAMPKPPESRVLARVNGAPITEAELRRAVLRQKGRLATDVASRGQALDALLFERAVRLAARKAGVMVPEDEVDAALLAMRRGYSADAFDASLFAARLSAAEIREVARERLVVEALLRKQGIDKPDVTDAEIEERWKSWPKERLPDRARLAQILVRTEDLAKKIHGDLTAKGVDKIKKFAELAKRHSLGPERVHGGRLGWFHRGDGPKVFETAFALKVGVVGDVVASDYGYHIFLVEERSAAKDATLADVREKIALELKEKKLRDAEEAWRKTILAGVEIERDSKALETIQ